MNRDIMDANAGTSMTRVEVRRRVSFVFRVGFASQTLMTSRSLYLKDFRRVCPPRYLLEKRVLSVNQTCRRPFHRVVAHFGELRVGSRFLKKLLLLFVDDA